MHYRSDIGPRMIRRRSERTRSSPGSTAKASLLCCCCSAVLVVITDGASSTTLRHLNSTNTSTENLFAPLRPVVTTITSSERKSSRAARPSVKDGPSLRSNRKMKLSDTTLADRLVELDVADQDFLNRLMNEKQRRVAPVHPPKPKGAKSGTDYRFLLTSIVGSVLLFGVAHFLGNSPEFALAAVWKDLQKASLSAVAVHGAWSAWQWIRRGSAGAPAPGGRSLTWSQNLALFLVTFGKPDMLHYLWNRVLPVMGKTMRKMITAELWNRFWNKLFAQAGEVLTVTLFPVTDAPTHGSGVLSKLMHQSAVNSFLAAAVARGTKRLFQSALQAHLQEAALTVIRTTASAVQDAQSQLFFSYQEMEVREETGEVFEPEEEVQSEGLDLVDDTDQEDVGELSDGEERAVDLSDAEEEQVEEMKLDDDKPEATDVLSGTEDEAGEPPEAILERLLCSGDSTDCTDE